MPSQARSSLEVSSNFIRCVQIGQILAGDEVLRVKASRLFQSARKADTVASLRGEEFVLLLKRSRVYPRLLPCPASDCSRNQVLLLLRREPLCEILLNLQNRYGETAHPTRSWKQAGLHLHS